MLAKKFSEISILEAIICVSIKSLKASCLHSKSSRGLMLRPKSMTQTKRDESLGPTWKLLLTDRVLGQDSRQLYK